MEAFFFLPVSQSIPVTGSQLVFIWPVHLLKHKLFVAVAIASGPIVVQQTLVCSRSICGKHVGLAQFYSTCGNLKPFTLKDLFALSAKIMENSSISADYPLKCLGALCNFQSCQLGFSAKFAGRFNGRHSVQLNGRQARHQFPVSFVWEHLLPKHSKQFLKLFLNS